MGYFCPNFRSFSVILALFLRGFYKREIRLNIQEGRKHEIRNVFYFIPYASLEENGIKTPFLSFLEVFLVFWPKVAILATFPVFLAKSAPFCQITLTRTARNDPILDTQNANKNTLDGKLVRFLSGKRV